MPLGSCNLRVRTHLCKPQTVKEGFDEDYGILCDAGKISILSKTYEGFRLSHMSPVSNVAKILYCGERRTYYIRAVPYTGNLKRRAIR
jgi:hypothetical protein